jgi:hypothetical protein
MIAAISRQMLRSASPQQLAARRAGTQRAAKKELYESTPYGKTYCSQNPRVKRGETE